MIAISTCYYDKKKYSSWENVLVNIKKIGLSDIELDVNIPELWLEFIKNSVQNNEIKITSIHNYCPSLGKYKYFYSLASLDEENRNLAVNYTKKTIELAAKLAAKVVVIHLGQIETSFSGKDLYIYSLNFDFNNNKFLEKQRNDVWVERQKKSQIYLDKLMKSLDEIVSFASNKNIKIGIENRPYITDLPNLEEAKYILAEFDTKTLGYWHDVGHAEMSARLGYIERHEDYLETLQDYLIGIHLHDIKKISDHLLPGYGDFDFKMLRQYFSQNDEIIKVLEVHQSDKYTDNDIKKSIKILNKFGIS